MIARTVRVDRLGDSLGIHFPSEFVDSARLKEKSLVEITSDGNSLIIKKVEENRKNIKELFSEHPSDYHVEDEEIEWGIPVGDETW